MLLSSSIITVCYWSYFKLKFWFSLKQRAFFHNAWHFGTLHLFIQGFIVTNSVTESSISMQDSGFYRKRTYCTGNSISKLMSATIEKGTEKRRARMYTKSHPLDCQWKSDPSPLQRNQQASSIKQLSFFKSRYNPIPYSMAKKKKI